MQGVVGRMGKAEVDEARRDASARHGFVQDYSPSAHQQRSHLCHRKPVAANCSLYRQHHLNVACLHNEIQAILQRITYSSISLRSFAAFSSTFSPELRIHRLPCMAELCHACVDYRSPSTSNVKSANLAGHKIAKLYALYCINISGHVTKQRIRLCTSPICHKSGCCLGDVPDYISVSPSKHISCCAVARIALVKLMWAVSLVVPPVGCRLRRAR